VNSRDLDRWDITFPSALVLVITSMVVVSCAPPQVSSLEAYPKEKRTVYAGPNVGDFKELGEVRAGERLVLIGRNGSTWVAFNYGDNLGWIQEFVLSFDGKHMGLPEIAPQTIVLSGQPPPPPPTSSTTKGYSWRDASDHLGDFTTICGPVVTTFYASDSNGQPTFLNVGEDFPSSRRFIVLIWGDDRGRFPGRPEDIYRGKDICATGEVEVFEGIYEIEISSPLSIDLP